MIRYHDDLIQGSDEWLAARCGLITASEMKLILTPTLKIADNEKTRGHLWELLSQRITKYVEPHYVSDDMLRGHDDEIEARNLYTKHFAPVTECGFITNDRWGFKLGYSPDGLIGDKGLLECKSRRQKFQVQTIVEYHGGQTIPGEYLMQCQTGMLVAEREWIDLISYSGGLPMIPMRVWPDDAVQEAILTASHEAEQKIARHMDAYLEAVDALALIPTERRVVQEMYV